MSLNIRLSKCQIKYYCEIWIRFNCEFCYNYFSLKKKHSHFYYLFCSICIVMLSIQWLLFSQIIMNFVVWINHIVLIMCSLVSVKFFLESWLSFSQYCSLQLTCWCKHQHKIDQKINQNTKYQLSLKCFSFFAQQDSTVWQISCDWK